MLPDTRIVLLHGVGLDRTMWRPVIEAMGEFGDRCHALDLPGHGAQPPLRAPQTLGSLAADVLARLDTTRPVHLVGFSLGALVAQHLARYSADLVATLVSVNSVCRRTPEEAARVAARLATAGEDFDAGVEVAIERWFPADSTAVPQPVIDATRRTLLANDLESYLHAYSVFAGGDREIGPELGNIAVPSLAVTGELDPGSTPEMSLRLAAAIPGGRAVVVPGARHMLPVENAPALAAALTAFFTEHAVEHSPQHITEHEGTRS